MFDKKKYQKFVNGLNEAIDYYNSTDKSFSVTTFQETLGNADGNKSLKHKIKFEIHLSKEGSYLYYILNKVFEMPFTIDISNLTIERLDFDEEGLNNALKREDYKMSMTKDKRSQQPSISVNKDRVYVINGFEGDYINPVVKQNTTDSKLSDEELNQMIRTSKPMTTFFMIDNYYPDVL
ncbi:hypothetical protein [Staphylococcus caprae]|uniref:hypothetical protein n=1 Tax=Staphylococcus caprae TaxID=29380 RepID=UPI00145218FF|nr:hypothetical protein [Staphylococcus caprae]QJE26601.1 hypothetical protein HHJ99_12590 [Staphylococcus caprae]QJE26624.1 hypothetical protein HHJ99_12705 [Staphylococcus caprae]